ncbi:hypothetical protein RV11_GL001356 [Enterococcus phoeniculicola]|jgi:hypothetical protein|uniref:Uncharacterized protein n=1 Tax=Enterococcus phoeniculicola ATCC BAA-412 TaxID=1158610 RepID=R3X517_9ENTE|nr:hypothetical protein [Enterococcus phoeniculicola]EOL49135.1 hypothetical protein UC3_00230 [Enterococcus phoeniculicola ATCC BAA-412]EOT70948.1 hypothetical protein I589_03432 [Enterococcus phoeniculicola ATCC BAA-412]OJG70488.1 hypothetical protein RV11_GL001356 [Enterococcus phoeniculicola]
MEKVRNFLISFVALTAFLSLYIGGIFVYPLVISIVLYALFELSVALKNKQNLKKQ